MNDENYSPVYLLTRGDLVESVHYGSIAIVNPHNELVAWYGNPDAITFLRSTAKPFQAMPFIESGGAEHYQLTLKEIALVCASHSGTDEHTTVLESIQKKCGIQESDLMCGVDAPLHRGTAQEIARRGEEPTPNRHNCSGKHSGMLAFARFRELPYDPAHNPYIDLSHPIQASIVSTFAEMVGLPVSEVHIGVDGCSAPNFAVPLRNTALGFARLCDPTGLPDRRQKACRTITSAMMTNPFMVGGPNSFDTALMEAAPGKIVCKGGAEGYQGIGIKPGAIRPGSPALGIAFKISDGDYRHLARSAVALEILRQLEILGANEMEILSRFGPVTQLTNFRKIHVGDGFPSFGLNYRS